jgi:lipopolysaccharide export system protein LptA
VSLKISRLRRWFAAVAIALILLVAGVYFSARHRVQNALKQVPDKIGVEIQQSAKGFTISKSYQGHTLFKVEASKAVQFKEGGRGELHDVEITVYGRDSGRFDRITGKDFEYNALSGDVTSKGEVQLDLESNPGGSGRPDQSLPGDLKNPVHLKTTDLVFNQKTGDARSDGEVEFEVPQAKGSAVGLSYNATSNVLTLNSQIRVTLDGVTPTAIAADRGTISKTSRTVVLEHPRIVEGSERSEADRATIFFSADSKLERALAQGNVLIGSDRPNGVGIKIKAGQLDLLIGTERNMLGRAILSDGVRFETADEYGVQGKAGRAVLDFEGNTLNVVHADQGVVLTQHPSSSGKLPSTKSPKSQDFELSSPAMDFFLADGRLIRRAETSGPPSIAISSANVGTAADETVITAAKFEASFDDKGKLAAVHGGPDSRIVTKSPGKADRVSTSETLDAEFQHGGSITALTQNGNFEYSEAGTKARADTARYSPTDQMLVLDGSPRVTDGGVTTTAQTIRLNRTTGTAYAQGDVKTTDASLQSQTGRGLPSSASHVTADSMSATRSPAVALYKGNVQVWQDANSVRAPSVEFDRDRRSVVAQGSRDQRVSTTLSQSDNQGKITSIAISADRLTYSIDERDDVRKVHFEGNVIAVGKDITSTASQMDCFLRGRSQAIGGTQLATARSLEKIVASGAVVVSETGRRATGNKLVYTAADDKFVMSGGPPSIFDAERGVITGVSLTLYGHDGRVLVEGNDQSPAVTETRVAR